MLSGHHHRVGRLAEALARRMDLPESLAVMLGRAAAAHDIGKIALPDQLVFKPGPLDAAERAIMRRHAELGHSILAGSGDPMVELAARVALYHHEAWDGSGYPHGLSGEAIPLEARIVAVCDAYDSLRMPAPWKPGLDHQTTLELMVGGCMDYQPGMFDPAILDLLHRRSLSLRKAWESA